jgi:anaerobic selenocysteine-containing dehydrogenase
VLPAASFLEFDDLVTPYFHLLLSAQAAAMAPPGEALPNQEIFRRLARAMGYEEPELFESDRSILDTVLEKSGLGITFDELKQEGTIDPFEEALVQFQDLKFPTPSGRIEIASGRAEADGHPRVPQPSHDPRPPRGRWRLLSPASRWQMNDSYANDPTIARKLGPAAVTLHPDDARALGLQVGDPVRLSNKLGEMTLEAAISDHVPQGAALSHKSDMGESSSVHGTLVEIRRVDA